MAMRQHFSRRRRLGATLKRPNRAATRVVLALALAMPGLAYPATLPELLRMPLEQLLRLKISPVAGADGAKR
jgi:hypothetical protein